MKLKMLIAVIISILIISLIPLTYAYYKKGVIYYNLFNLEGGDISVSMNGDFENYVQAFDLNEGVISGGEYYSESVNFLVNVTIHDENSQNYINNLTVALKYTGELHVCLRAKVNFYWTQNTENGIVFPRMNSSNIFNYNDVNFNRIKESDNAFDSSVLYYFGAQDTEGWNYEIPVATTGNTYYNLINGVNELDIYPPTYSLVVKFNFEAVQYNRADYIWNIDSLPQQS